MFCMIMCKDRHPSAATTSPCLIEGFQGARFSSRVRSAPKALSQLCIEFSYAGYFPCRDTGGAMVSGMGSPGSRGSVVRPKADDNDLAAVRSNQLGRRIQIQWAGPSP